MIVPSRFQTYLGSLARSARPSYADCLRHAAALPLVATPAAPLRQLAAEPCVAPAAADWPRSSSQAA